MQGLGWVSIRSEAWVLGRSFVQGHQNLISGILRSLGSNARFHVARLLCSQANGPREKVYPPWEPGCLLQGDFFDWSSLNQALFQA